MDNDINNPNNWRKNTQKCDGCTLNHYYHTADKLLELNKNKFQGKYVHILALPYIFAALEYHYDRWVELEKIDDHVSACHEICAYLNQIGRLMTFFRKSEIAKQITTRSYIKYNASNTIFAEFLDNKYAGHRAIDWSRPDNGDEPHTMINTELSFYIGNMKEGGVTVYQLHSKDYDFLKVNNNIPYYTFNLTLQHPLIMQELLKLLNKVVDGIDKNAEHGKDLGYT